MRNKFPSLTAAVSVALSFLLMLLALSIQQAYANSGFSDTSFHWTETFMYWMKDNGLSSGYSDGSFTPDNPITRAAVASLPHHRTGSGATYVHTPPYGLSA